jgi:hypothetical protein
MSRKDKYILSELILPPRPKLDAPTGRLIDLHAMAIVQSYSKELASCQISAWLVYADEVKAELIRRTQKEVTKQDQTADLLVSN